MRNVGKTAVLTRASVGVWAWVFPLFNPVGRIVFLSVEFPHPLLGQFGVLDLLDALPPPTWASQRLNGSAFGLGMIRKAASVLAASVL